MAEPSPKRTKTLEDVEQDAGDWSPSSWRGKPIKQQPVYSDEAAVRKCAETLRSLPPIVHPSEVDKLRELLAEVADGKRFILQGGDCAERFSDCSQQPIENKLKIILQMSLVLIWGAGVPLVRIGRIAGQYSKPRSANYEKTPEGEIFCYKGDSINGYEKEDRTHDPQRLVEAYFRSAATFNYVRALCGNNSGFASLHNPETWDLAFAPEGGEKRGEYEQIRSQIVQAMHFMQTCGLSNTKEDSVDFYSSHEGLVLEYEEALTRQIRGTSYNTAAHMLWIGDRTRGVEDAHVEYFRGITNPIGCKVGPSMTQEDLLGLLAKLDPNKEKGRLVLITRMGAKKVRELLPPIVRAVQESGHCVVWQCDPMHGNTTTAGSFKTRAFDDVLGELLQTFQVHRELGSWLGGVHFEMTGEDVTECTGGSIDLLSTELSRNYQTYCDPRLNYTQALEMAFLMAKHLLKAREPSTPNRG